MGGEDDYRFMAIEDAMASLNQKVNIIGVVVEMGMPKRSKGTVWCGRSFSKNGKKLGAGVVSLK
ncbi:hypothetical protein CK203_091164 [Vitis vinifera]|nr:hypothetical protein CK203_091164 [Vitis vinifera]